MTPPVPPSPSLVHLRSLATSLASTNIFSMALYWSCWTLKAHFNCMDSLAKVLEPPCNICHQLRDLLLVLFALDVKVPGAGVRVVNEHVAKLVVGFDRLPPLGPSGDGHGCLVYPQP